LAALLKTVVHAQAFGVIGSWPARFAGGRGMRGRRTAFEIREHSAPQQPVGDDQPDRHAGEGRHLLVRVQQGERLRIARTISCCDSLLR
jgi:hypothetical protein